MAKLKKRIWPFTKWKIIPQIPLMIVQLNGMTWYIYLWAPFPTVCRVASGLTPWKEFWGVPLLLLLLSMLSRALRSREMLSTCLRWEGVNVSLRYYKTILHICGWNQRWTKEISFHSENGIYSSWSWLWMWTINLMWHALKSTMADIEERFNHNIKFSNLSILSIIIIYRISFSFTHKH